MNKHLVKGAVEQAAKRMARTWWLPDREILHNKHV